MIQKNSARIMFIGYMGMQHVYIKALCILKPFTTTCVLSELKTVPTYKS